MTLPPTLLGEGLGKQLVEAVIALRKRLGKGDGEFRGIGPDWTVRDGLPVINNLPNEPRCVWIHFAGLDENPEAPFAANYFKPRFTFYLMNRDGGSDPHAFDQIPGLLLLGRLVGVLTVKPADSTLDDSMDFDENVDVEHDTVMDPKTDRAVEFYAVSITYAMPLYALETS